MQNNTISKLTILILLGISNLYSQDAQQVKEIIIKIPEVPEVPKVEAIVPKVEAIVPKVITIDSNGNDISNNNSNDTSNYKRKYIQKKKKEKVTFSNRVAPEKYAIKKPKIDENVLVGDIKNGRVSAYLRSPLMSVDEAKKKLKEAGFDILTTYKVAKKGTVTSIVFTDNDMQKAASKNMRGFAANLRLVVDKKNKLVNISNPVYVMGAFMQKEYDAHIAQLTLTKLRNAFSDLENSKEIVKFKVLERFRFMENMPYYQDMKVIAKGDKKQLLAKVKKSKKIVFEQHLKNGATLLGVKLSKRTSKFVKKTGYENSGLLPYPVLIENGEAKIMAPQYYIAAMYPMLKMSQFMKIATVPGAITKEIDKMFR